MNEKYEKLVVNEKKKKERYQFFKYIFNISFWKY